MMDTIQSFDIGLSLGCNCEPAYQLRRLGLVPADRYYAFDFSHTRHAALLKMLACDLQDVFQGTGSLVCDTTDFRFAYRPQREISRTLEEFTIRANNTRAVRESGQRVLFARSVTVGSSREALVQWGEVHRALTDSGWQNFRLVFAVRSWQLDAPLRSGFATCPEYFHEPDQPAEDRESWNGNDSTWDMELPRVLSMTSNGAS